MNRVTFIIKSFERPACLERLMNSIRRYYPDVRVIVADDSKKDPAPASRHYDLIRLPFDVGLSAGRNAALGLVTTPYFLLLDDDFEFGRQTKIERMLEIALKCGHDIVGGAVREDGKIRRYEGSLERDRNDPKMLRYLKGTKPCGSGHETAGMVLNFFLGQTESVRSIGWDPALKLAEHTAFFWKAKGKLDIAYCKDVVIEHHKERTEDYRKYRGRARAFFADFLRKNGFERSVNFDGDVYDVSAKHL